MTAKHTIRRTKPWMALAATMALSLAMGTLAPPEGHTATGQLKKQCKKTCKTQKKVCLKSFKAQFKAAKKACKLEADKAAKKQCKKDAKAASKDNKTACKTGFKDDCKQCCSDQDDIAMCNVAVCGDGQIAGTEQCEDGNQVGGDGCSADCLIETAFEGGTRNFTYSDGSAFFTSFVGMNSIGTPMGTLPLVATPADENGVAQVTVQGPIYTFWDVDALGQNRRVCNKIESCTGTLYCDGGFNVDVDVVLNSVFGSTAQTLEDTLTDSACMHTGVCDGEPCCENACEGFGMGRCENNGALCADDTGCTGATCTENSGNDHVNVTPANPGMDSGPGALILTCMQAGKDVDLLVNPNPDCTNDAEIGYPVLEPNVYTTGTSNAVVINHCAGNAQGNLPGVVPEFSVSGENFNCSTWTSSDSAGTFAYTVPSEEPSDVVVTGDGASAGIFDD